MISCFFYLCKLNGAFQTRTGFLYSYTTSVKKRRSFLRKY